MSKLKLSDAQQYFLQIILNKNIIDEINFKRTFCDVLKKFKISYTEANLKDIYTKFLRETNDVIKHFSMEIRKGTDEVTGVTFFCLIRLSDAGSIGNLSALYSSMELNIYKRILTIIIESENGYIDYNNLIYQIIDDYDQLQTQAHSQSQITKIPTNKDIRLIIEKFVQDYWLVEVLGKPNMITLHGRAIMELSGYICELFDKDLLNHCFMCKNLLLCGTSCSNCDVKMHFHCAKNLFKDQKNCRSCKTPFTDEQIENLRETISSAKASYASQSQVV
jgi:hypothetical protein